MVAVLTSTKEDASFNSDYADLADVAAEYSVEPDDVLSALERMIMDHNDSP